MNKENIVSGNKIHFHNKGIKDIVYTILAVHNDGVISYYYETLHQHRKMRETFLLDKMQIPN